jgi:hypothetical protein
MLAARSAAVWLYITAEIGAVLVSIARAQPVFVHPPSAPGPSDFAQPPTLAQVHWLGPSIKQINVRCWHAEPSAPDKPVGGTSETQGIVAFIPVQGDRNLDTSFRQTDLGTFSGGGWSSSMKPDDMPVGIFISFKGHPVFRVNKIEYPFLAHELGEIFGPTGIGVRVSAEFLHTPTMGECYFYAAAWVAQ